MTRGRALLIILLIVALVIAGVARCEPDAPAPPRAAPDAVAARPTPADPDESRRARVHAGTNPVEERPTVTAPDPVTAQSPLTVTVRDASGDPLADVPILLLGGNALRGIGATDATGRVAQPADVGVTYHVATNLSGGSDVMYGPWSHSADGHSVELTLGPERIVNGRVFEQDGATPAAHVTVEVRWMLPDGSRRFHTGRNVRTFTGGDGHFTLRGAPVGPIKFVVRPGNTNDGGIVTADLPADQDEVTIVLSRLVTFEIVVQDAETGLAPDTAAMVTYRIDRDGEERYGSGAMTSGERIYPSGSEARQWFRQRVHPGIVERFRIHAIGYAPSELVTLDANQEPETRRRVVVSLVPDPSYSALVKLRLTVTEGSLAETVPVRWSQGGASLSHRWPVEDGAVSRRLLPGEATLTLGSERVQSNPGLLLPRTIELDLRPGDHVEQDVVLERGGAVRVLSGGAEDPPPPLTAAFARGLMVDVSALSRREGGRASWTVGPLRPGRWTLFFDDSTGLEPVDVDILVGQTVDVTVE